MCLQVLPSRNIAEFLQPLVLISDGRNEPLKNVQMIGKRMARNFAPRAEIPNTCFAGNLWAVSASTIGLAFSDMPAWAVA
jgi:hypothetical protein